jgi:hypothetical protein
MLLSRCFFVSCITDADKHLTFSVNAKGKYVVEKVPRQVGIRAGAIVEGFAESGDDTNDIQPLVWNDKDDKIITLGQMAKRHNINLESSFLVVEKKARYCTRLFKLDTKDYGLPQTRNRKVRHLAHVLT